MKIIKRLIPLSWRIAARNKQAQVRHRWSSDYRNSFVEDYVRVYRPDAFVDAFGAKEPPPYWENNYLNHCKFYRFAAQFVVGARVLDGGCGSGYGCRILAESGAKHVHGVDMSSHALEYGRQNHGLENVAFEKMSVTSLKIPSASVDVVVCSEVLEHVKEFGTQRKCVREFARVLRPGGVAVLATPNAEMLPGHGYEFEELRDLVASYFAEQVVFENAFIPFPEELRDNWYRRRAEGRTGVMLDHNIQLSETEPPSGYRLEDPEDLERFRGLLKGGPGLPTYEFAGVSADLSLLHNTHSFLVLARKAPGR